MSASIENKTNLKAVADLRRRMADNGFPPVALCNAVTGNKDTGKAPVSPKWPELARQDPPHDARAPVNPRSMNTGLACHGLRVVDIDIEDLDIATNARMYIELCFGDTIVRSRSNSARCGLIYRAAEGEPGKRVLRGKAGKIEILGRGQQLAAFGMHYSGVPLQWLEGSPEINHITTIPSVTEQQITDLFRGLAELVGAELPTSGLELRTVGSSGGHATATLTDIRSAMDVIPNNELPDWEAWNRLLMAVWAATGGSDEGKFIARRWSEKNDCHDDCAFNDRWAHYAKSPPTRIGAGSLFFMAQKACPGWIKPSEFAEHISGGSEFGPFEAESGTALSPNDDWASCLQREKGEPISNLANAMVAMRSAPQLHDAVGLDLMLRKPMLVRAMPRGTNNGLPRPVQDADVALAQEWLQWGGLKRIGKDVLHQAIELRAQELAFHPVRDYLEALAWDGTPRLATWLTRYLGATEQAPEYLEGIGTMFLISMIARVMRPGCKVDYMAILEGPQNAMKSTVCRILAGQWFSDSMPDIRNGGKDVSQHLNGKWLIEVAELSALGKSDSNALKSFITRAVEQYRPSYGRLEVFEPRQCVFIGTTNNATYLRDETGGRRFWPIKCGDILDVAGLARERDQLFAEAVNLYRADAQWWPNRDFEKRHIQAEQEARYEADAWEQAIADWLPGKASVTINDVARSALGIMLERLGTAEQRRISAALTRLGLRCKRSNGKRAWLPVTAEAVARRAALCSTSAPSDLALLG